MEVKGEGGVTVAELDEIEDIFLLLKEMFNEGEGVSEGGGVERVEDIVGGVWFQRKLIGLVASV